MNSSYCAFANAKYQIMVQPNEDISMFDVLSPIMISN